MRLLIIFSGLFLSINAGAQSSCSCAQDYLFTTSYMERNYPGFSDNVTSKNRAAYKEFRDSLGALIERNQPNRKKCLEYLQLYVEFFNDSHTSIFDEQPLVNEKDSTSLQHFFASEEYRQTEILPVDGYLLGQKPVTDLEGIYYSSDSTYKIGILRSATATRDYAGVIIESKTVLWSPGQVKMELKYNSTGTLTQRLFKRDHTATVLNEIKLENGNISSEIITWTKLGATPARFGSPGMKQLYEFRLLDSLTNYIRVSSFHGNLYASLDSFYKAIAADVYKKPYLIIDVRNNAGGNTGNALPLVEYFYTKPIVMKLLVQTYVTKDVLQRNEEVLNDMKNYPDLYGKENLARAEKDLEQLKKVKLNSFYPTKALKQIMRFKAHALPLKVAILYNRGCASACEDLLFFARYPSKALLMGENSGGYVGYGNVYPLKTPCLAFTLNCTTTRYDRSQRQYEGTGIPPQYRLDKNRDWVEQALEIMRR